MKSTTIFRLRHNRKYTTFVETPSCGMVKVAFEPIVYFGHVENSMFSTNEEEVIEALQKHREFGALIYIEEPGHIELPVQGTGIPAADPNSLLSDAVPVVEEPSVTSLQLANNWLQHTHGCVFCATKKDAVKAEAARKYNTIFPNW